MCDSVKNIKFRAYFYVLKCVYSLSCSPDPYNYVNVFYYGTELRNLYCNWTNLDRRFQADVVGVIRVVEQYIAIIPSVLNC